MEDAYYLSPTAWVYWQIVEPWSAWGPINAAMDRQPEDALRAEPTFVYQKFRIFAHFTRFIRPGMVILDHQEPQLMVAYDQAADSYAGIFLNRGPARSLTLRGWKAGRTVELVRSAFNGSKVWETALIESGPELKLEAGADEIISFRMP